MKHFRVIAAVAITGLVGVIPAAAQGKSGTAGAGATGHGRPTSTTSPAGAKATTSDATPHGKSADAGTHGSDKSGKPSKTTTASTNTTTPGANALATKIASHPEQLAKINGMLPQGMTLDQATAGFRNQGQFIAALNASKQQGVPFASLQKAMTVDGLSLGQAVRQLKTPPAPAPTGSSSSATGGGSVTTPTTGAS